MELPGLVAGMGGIRAALPLRSPEMKMSRLLRADLALIAITLIWGSSFTLVKQSLAQSSPILFISLRFWIATIVAVALARGALKGISGLTVRRGMILACALLGGFVFQTLGLRTTTPAQSAFVTSLSVLLVPLVGMFFFGHRPRARTLAGVAVATVGLAFLTLGRLEFHISRGDALTLVCAVFFALHILLIGRYLPTSDFRQLAVLQLVGAAAMGTLLSPVLESPFLFWDGLFAAYLVFTGVFATGIAFYVQNKAQQYTTPNRTALIFSLEPFSAAIFAYWILGHAPSGKEWFGGCLVLAGILISELRRTAAAPQPGEPSKIWNSSDPIA